MLQWFIRFPEFAEFSEFLFHLGKLYWNEHVQKFNSYTMYQVVEEFTFDKKEIYIFQ